MGHPVHGQARKAQDGQWVSGQRAARGGGQPLDLDMTRGDGRKPEDAPALDRDVGDADVVPELVLRREAVEKAV